MREDGGEPGPRNTFMPITRTRTLKSIREACRISGPGQRTLVGARQVNAGATPWENPRERSFTETPEDSVSTLDLRLRFTLQIPETTRQKIFKDDRKTTNLSWVPLMAGLKNCYSWTRTSRKTIVEWDLGRLARWFYGIFIVIWIGGTNDLFGHFENIFTSLTIDGQLEK